jgi:hypothetical protein
VADVDRRGGGGAADVQSAADAAFGYAGLLYYVGLVPALVGSALLGYAVLGGRTRYPRWFAGLNPAVLFLLAGSFRWASAPLGGLLAIGAGNLVFLCFFAVSTVLLWNGSAAKTGG